MISYLKTYGRRVSARDGWRCHYCGIALVPMDAQEGDSRYFKPAEPSLYKGDVHWYFPLKEGVSRPNIDHKTPRSWGGTDDLTNLVLACRDCNRRKLDRYDHDQFVALIETESKAQ